MLKVERQYVERLEHWRDSFLEALDDLIPSKGHVKRGYIEAAILFYKTQIPKKKLTAVPAKEK